MLDSEYLTVTLQNSHHNKSELGVFFKEPPYTTAAFPYVEKLLEAEIPLLFLSQCRNPHHQSLRDELRNTVIGHLYEHILLEYLVQISDSQGHHFFEFVGETSWDWDQESEGIYHITINVGSDHSQLLQDAIACTNALMEKILGVFYNRHESVLA